ncbi:MAG: iron chaperone [Planctomycetaceae bacterium]
MKEAAVTIDDYLNDVAPKQKERLNQLRELVHKLAPDVTECISYGIPAFRRYGKLLLAMGGAAKHYALYPMSSATIQMMQAEVAGHDTSKGTIRLDPDKPFPTALLKKLIRARIAEQEIQVGEKAKKQPKTNTKAKAAAKPKKHAKAGSAPKRKTGASQQKTKITKNH